jgi:hypothetical protein
VQENMTRAVPFTEHGLRRAMAAARKEGWLLQGRQVVALTKDTAVIETTTGILSYRRNNKPAFGPLGDSLDDMGAC